MLLPGEVRGRMKFATETAHGGDVDTGYAKLEEGCGGVRGLRVWA